MMEPAQPIILSGAEKLVLAGAIVKALVATVFAAVSWPFRQGGSRYSRDIIYSGLRAFTRSTTVRHARAFSATTDQVYEQFAKKKDIEAQTWTLEDGTKAHLLNFSPRAKKVLLWFHGGGYAMWANNGHMNLLWDGIVEQSNREISVVILSYGVTPHAAYPQQLQQAAGLLNYITKISNVPASSIILGGDSAGGNLVLALLSHISHAHPSVPIVDIHIPLLGAILVSPWVSFNTGSKSMTYNASKDVLDISTLQHWSQSFLINARSDNYNTPLNAALEWWSDVKVGQVLITCGSEEVFIDDIKAFYDVFKTAHPSVKIVVGKGEIHDAPVVDTMMGFPLGEQAKAIQAFLKSL